MDMKKHYIFSLLSVAMLAACTPRHGVEVAQAPETKTEFRAKSSDKIPQDVTAICVDGSYSKSPIEHACQGNGGIVKAFMHYHAD